MCVYEKISHHTGIDLIWALLNRLVLAGCCLSEKMAIVSQGLSRWTWATLVAALSGFPPATYLPLLQFHRGARSAQPRRGAHCIVQQQIVGAFQQSGGGRDHQWCEVGNSGTLRSKTMAPNDLKKLADQHHDQGSALWFLLGSSKPSNRATKLGKIMRLYVRV